MVSMRAKFEALVRDLDKEALEQLRRSVTSEIDGRRETTGAFQMENIHPRMTAEEKDQAAKEIVRVLREQGS
jgi:hypothetical protein